MFRVLIPLLILFMLGAATFLRDAASPAAAGGPSVPGQYIVVLKDDADSDSEARNAVRNHGVGIDHVYGHAIKGYAFHGTSTDAAALARDPRVKYVVPDRIITALDGPGGNAKPGGGGGSAQATQTIPTGINRIEADINSQHSGGGSGSVSSPAIAVIDTGSGPHAELNVVGGKNCSTGFSYSDGNGHGTHVAGTIAARDNSAGVVGVVPGAPIYSVRVLNNQGSGTWSSVICGINWVAQNAAALNIRVANMSLGGAGADDGNCGNTNADVLHQAICNLVNQKGVTVVVAAGNDAADFATSVPASYDEVLTVAAVADFDGKPGGLGAATCRADVDDTSADFSNYATSAADKGHLIAAPGVCILSTWKGGGYNTISGTSMATPHVTGAVALCISRGLCTGSPAAIIATLRRDAAAWLSDNPGYGFTADGGRSYGNLVSVGGY